MTKKEFKQMDQRIRKLVTKALNPKDNIDKLYVSRKGGRALMIAWMNQYKDSKTTLKEQRKTNYCEQ